MNSVIAFEDFKKICRVCLKDCTVLVPLYGTSLDSMLMDVASIKVSTDDQLPDKLCKSCSLQISRFYTFKMHCERNDLILRSTYDENLKTEFKNKQMKAALHKKLLDEIKFKKRVMDLANRDTTSDNYYYSLFLPTTEDEIDISAELTIDQSGNLVSNDLLAETSGVSHSMDIFPCKGHSKDDCANCNRISVIQSDYQPENLEIMNLPHKCPECEERFKTKLNLQTHIVQHVKRVTCEVCGKTMSSVALQRHSKIHAAIKPHKCDVCDRRFADIGNLAKHKRKHTGELRNANGKNFLCNVCGKSFKWSTSLSKHSKYHTGKKLFTCHFCDKHYVERKSLIIHIRGHTGEKPHICTLCNRGFTQKANLNKHARVHTRERPYSCPVCSKSFSQKGYITVHMRTHTGEKPYKCSICQKSFSGKNSLTSHMKQHDGNTTTILSSREYASIEGPGDLSKETVSQELIGNPTGKEMFASMETNLSVINFPGEKKCEICDKSLPTSMDLLFHCHDEHSDSYI